MIRKATEDEIRYFKVLLDVFPGVYELNLEKVRRNLWLVPAEAGYKWWSLDEVYRMFKKLEFTTRIDLAIGYEAWKLLQETEGAKEFEKDLHKMGQQLNLFNRY